jgi:hypothetical protein
VNTLTLREVITEGVSKQGAKTHLPSLMGFAGWVSMLLFLLVAGAVANDQIFTTSGERHGTALDLTSAIQFPHPIRVFAPQNPMNPPFHRCVLMASLVE